MELEGYVNEFNEMVKGIMGVTGDSGIEVLPVVPMIFEGLDKVGKELLGRLRGRIRWVGRAGGWAEIAELSETGRKECDDECEGCLIGKQGFMVMYGKQQECKAWRKEETPSP
jgi:hypothetical protein